MEYVGPFKAKTHVLFNPRSDICLGHIDLVRLDIDDLKTSPILFLIWEKC